ncbi:hypothetical protein Bca101_012948 [Brassica carinata]
MSSSPSLISSMTVLPRDHRTSSSLSSRPVSFVMSPESDLEHHSLPPPALCHHAREVAGTIERSELSAPVNMEKASLVKHVEKIIGEPSGIRGRHVEK